MPEQPLVSIIVPIYNAQDHIARCVESIRRQTYKNIEILLLNDGSQDVSLQVCEMYARVDDRIVLIDKANSGVAATRNLGLRQAKGKYLQFVDADDTLLPGLWQALPAAFDAQPGLILYGMVRASGPAPNPLAPGCYAGPAALGDALDPLLFESGYLAAPYPKLFRLDVIRRNKLRFDPRLKINEDVLFNLQYLRFLHFFTKKLCHLLPCRCIL